MTQAQRDIRRKLDARHVTYLYDDDGESRPYAGVYASSEATPVAFGIATTGPRPVKWCMKPSAPASSLPLS